MVLVPLVSLAAVRESAPADIELRAAREPASEAVAAEARDAAAERLERYGAPIRSSRSAAQLREFERANDEATTTTEAPTTTAAPTTTTTARPEPTTTVTAAKAATTTAKPKTATTAAPTTTAKATTTTTTAKPPSTTSTMGPQPACCREEGGASYHDYPDVRTCAHKSLPKGTALRVTNLANGKRTTCVVNDRGPYVQGRILDLSREAFAEIAAISDGVIRVSIEW